MELKPLNEPKVKTLYPDAGGYTGFSIFVWEIELERDWGRLRVFVLEGRFYVRGVVMETEMYVNGNERFVMDYHDRCFTGWKIGIDEVTKVSEHEKPN